MKKIKRIIAIMLVMLMLAGISAICALADESETICVAIRIEGIGKALYYNRNFEVPEGATVLDLMEKLNETDDTPEVDIADSVYGAYIGRIGELAEMDYGPMSGWSYLVNDESPAFGISMFELSDGDSVVVYFGDPFSTGMQYPITDLSKLYSDGIISFTSIDTEYDEEWTPIITENPVSGATVTLNSVTYTTDEDGGIKISDKTGLAGFRALQIERYDGETGVPTVLRLEPDFEMYVPFADTDDGAWYELAVMFCVREWDFQGTNLSANLFEPLRTMTMEELVTVLTRVADADIEPQTDPWYAGALEWAVENDIIAEEDFAEGAGIPKDMFLHMFYLAVALTGDQDMTVRADITGAVDYDDINEEYLEAVSWAVAMDIVQGTSDEELIIDPGFEFNRAMVCRLLYNFFG